MMHLLHPRKSRRPEALGDFGLERLESAVGVLRLVVAEIPRRHVGEDDLALPQLRDDCGLATVPDHHTAKLGIPARQGNPAADAIDTRDLVSEVLANLGN